MPANVPVGEENAAVGGNVQELVAPRPPGDDALPARKGRAPQRQALVRPGGAEPDFVAPRRPGRGRDRRELFRKPSALPFQIHERKESALVAAKRVLDESDRV